MGLFSNPAKDAKKIQKIIDYRILKAAWDCQAQINIGSAASTHKATTPAWFALFAIQNYKGDFNKFSSEEAHLLRGLTDVHATYDDIITSLESNSRNEELGRYILNTHPALQELVPHEYDNALKINGYIVNVIKLYQLMLEDFYKKYQKKIDPVIERLENNL